MFEIDVFVGCTFGSRPLENDRIPWNDFYVIAGAIFVTFRLSATAKASRPVQF